MPLGKYCRKSPLVFSLLPRCHGLWGSGALGLWGSGIGVWAVLIRKDRIKIVRTHKYKPTTDRSYCQIWCLRIVGHAAIWSGLVVSIPSLNRDAGDDFGEVIKAA